LIPYPDILFQNIVQVDVKVEDSPVQMKTQKTKPSTFSNKQLPQGCLQDDAWRGIVIPTFIWWAAHQEDPWKIKEEEALAALQSIWNPVYKKISRTITLDDPVFKNVSTFTISSIELFLNISLGLAASE
jgi:hypothetical protein